MIMKKALRIIALHVVITTAMAQGQQESVSDERLKQVMLRQLCSGHIPPIEFDANGEAIPYHPPTMQSIATRYAVSFERMTRMLEELINTNLVIFEKLPVPADSDRKMRDAYLSAAQDVYPLIPWLQTFQNTNTVAVLQKCVMSAHKQISCNAVETYVVIEGTKSIPFFRDAFKSERLTTDQRNRLIQHLEGTITKLNKENKPNDVEKITAFLQEMKQTEQP